MNSIIELFNGLTDEELLVLMNEIEHSELTGSYPNDAEIRKLCKRVSELTQQELSSNLFMVHLNVLKECAFRWKKIIKI